jgi:glycosyltransferase involved in cell wall biosynthesis
VGNDYLRQYAEPLNPQVTVLPTTIDTEKYQPKASTALQTPPVVGWSGSHSTLRHLEWFVPILQEIRASASFRFKVIGADQFAIPGIDVESVPWRVATETTDIQSIDIGVMPLPDDQWSRGKCGLKALQYMALGIPVVASPVGVNSTIIDDGRNGFLASDPAEWSAKVRRLLEDADLRRRFAAEGRRTVEEYYSARTQVPRLVELFEGLRASQQKESNGQVRCPS